MPELPTHGISFAMISTRLAAVITVFALFLTARETMVILQHPRNCNTSCGWKHSHDAVSVHDGNSVSTTFAESVGLDDVQMHPLDDVLLLIFLDDVLLLIF